MTITIERLEFETVIGILPHERTAPQRVRVDCTIDYRYTPGIFIDYAQVAEHIRTLMQHERFELIEEALLALSSALKAAFPPIETLELSIRKPDILSHCTVGVGERFRF